MNPAMNSVPDRFTPGFRSRREQIDAQPALGLGTPLLLRSEALDRRSLTGVPCKSVCAEGSNRVCIAGQVWSRLATENKRFIQSKFGSIPDSLTEVRP
jgi:hypothetical protein